MAGIVSLRRARKRRARVEARNQADANAFQHGESKAERRLRAAREALDERRLEGHRGDSAEDGAQDGAQNGAKDRE